MAHFLGKKTIQFHQSLTPIFLHWLAVLAADGLVPALDTDGLLVFFRVIVRHGIFTNMIFIF